MNIKELGMLCMGLSTLYMHAMQQQPTISTQSFQDACKNGQMSLGREKPLEISAPDLLHCITHCNDIMVVNVLGKRFWEDARIKGSICAPLKDLEQEATKWHKNQKIVVYCACKQCDASIKAYNLLKSMGFKRVLAYEGGIREWYRKGLPCEGPCKYEYLMRDDDYRGEEKRK